ncbi:G-type lectin S-receptor-like serine/threonine-protein kinase [Forsythia ovata]|uniref:non-specific serine/threonine protein kinase n=1 Tax=Forsythia ovata TaxID=205694 RepID=A0ABD1WXX8_9LAMI
MEIPHVDFYGFDLNSTSPLTLEACRDMCLRDFRCLAFTYRILGQGFCYLKSALLNGYENPDFPASIYIKVPSSVQPPNPSILYESRTMCVVGSLSMYDFTPKRVKWIYIYSFCAALGGLELMFIVLGWWFLFRKYRVPASVEAGYRMISSNFKRYTYAELKKATTNFKTELGRGGSGTVYIGVLSDGREVAVKKLGDVFQVQDEHSAEISTIGKINHMNLVRMWGFCSEGRHRLLVYEYIKNSSLDKHLFDSNFPHMETKVYGGIRDSQRFSLPPP